MESNEEKRNFFLALGLSLLVIVGWNYFFAAKPQPQPAQLAQTQQGNTDDNPVSAKTSQIPALPVPQAPSNTIKEIEHDFETQNFLAQLNNIGGNLQAWDLKKYWKETDHKEPVAMVVEKESPLWVELADTRGRLILNDRDRAYQSLDQSKDSWRLGSREQNLYIQKTYAFDELNTLLLTLQVQNLDASPFRGNLTLNWETPKPTKKKSRSFMMGMPSDTLEGLIFAGNALKKSDDESISDEAIKWVGIDRKYFLSAILPQTAPGQSASIRENEQNNSIAVSLRMPETMIRHNESATYQFRIYLGPKDRATLKQIEPTLLKSIDYGWFTAIGQPLFFLMRFFYNLVGNYGFAIMLMTLVVKLVLFPLTHSSLRNMKKMQGLQPAMKALQEKYKEDRQRLNMEMAGLFKREKVNPMMGCFPMLLQFPVWIALYRVIFMSIELRHAPFMFWIQDLSAKDPYYVIPVLMGISFIAQQKLMPTTDPQQSRMMLIMSGVFTLFMLNLPSGLLLYIFVNNVLSIIQQKMIHADAKAA